MVHENYQKIIRIVVNERIILKILTVEDVSNAYVAWLNDYEVTKFTEQKYFVHTLESTIKFVSQKLVSENDLLFGIFLDGEHIGNIKLGRINFNHMTAEVSYIIGEKRFWRRGIASKCIDSILKFACTDLNLKKINAGYYENNIGSEKVLRKCGFVVEGIKTADILFETKRINSILVGYKSTVK